MFPIFLIQWIREYLGNAEEYLYIEAAPILLIRLYTDDKYIPVVLNAR